MRFVPDVGRLGPEGEHRASGDISVVMLCTGDAAITPGGVERYTQELRHALRSAGAGVTSVVIGPADPASGHIVGGHSKGSLITRLLSYTRAARRAGKDSFLVDSHFALYGALPIRTVLRKRPLAVHFHGPWARETVAERGGGGLSFRARHALERSIYRRARVVVTLSGAFRRVLIEEYRVEPWSVRVIPPGVDHQFFSPGDPADSRRLLDLDAAAPVVVCARRLVTRVGLDVLLDAWPEVLEQHPSAILVIAGDGPLRQELEARAKELGVGASVHFLGRVPETTLLAAYRAADVAVVPSRSLEGFGLVVLEAMACGVPVVTTDVGGLPEAAGALGANLVVPSGDSGALAERLSLVLAHKLPVPSRSELRDHAVSHDWGNVGERHVGLYREMVNGAPRRRRIVILDHSAAMSGAEIALLRLAPALGERYDVHVILAEDGPLVGALSRAGVSVEVLALNAQVGTTPRERAVTLRGVPSQLGAAAYAARLARLLRRHKPDLVHGNSLKACFYGSVASRLARVPFIWHARDRVAIEYLPPAAVRVGRQLARSLPAAVIANSRDTLATLGPARRLDAQSRRVVIDDPIPQQQSAELPSPPDPFTVGMVGRITPWKGQDVFLEAFELAFPAGEERAVIVGAPLFGEDDFYAAIRTRWGHPPWSERVVFKGFVDDVPAELRTFSVLVHASVIPEPFGMVVVEGMAAGLPVIAADAGGPREVISDGEDGILVPPKDVQALASALRELAADPERRETLGAAARSTARRFAPNRVAGDVGALYERVLKS